MALAGLDADQRQEIESEIRALAGVLHVSIEADGGTVWVVREPGAEPVPLELAVRTRLTELGHAAEGVRLSLAVPLEAEPRRRVRFLDAERTQEESGQVSVRVRLEWNDTEVSADASGEKGAAIELKTTGVAAVRALETLAGAELGLRIIGVKQIHAFDTEVTVASLLRRGDVQPKKLVGAAVVEENPLKAAAIAVLDALNRTLGNFLATDD